MRSSSAQPPLMHQKFMENFPKLKEAWECLGEAGKQGPLDDKTSRLVKLAIAIGALKEGAVHANVRKAIAMGITEEEILQVVSLAAGKIGMPSTVAVYSWMQDVLEED